MAYRRKRRKAEVKPKRPAKSTTKPSRKEIAEALKKAAAMHFTKRGYAVNVEVGLNKRGRLRADLYCFTMLPHTVIVEVKSCKADFDNDDKHTKYHEFCNQMYFCVPNKKLAQHVAENVECGVLYLSKNTGHLKCIKPSPKREVDKDILVNMILRMGYRGAAYTKRNTRRTRVFL